MELGIRAETAVVERAGVDRNSTSGALLEAWLDRRPDPKLLIAWSHLVQAMSEQLGPDEAARLKTALLERSRAVAAATGGLFGVGSKISASEAAMLAKLETAFSSSP